MDKKDCLQVLTKLEAVFPKFDILKHQNVVAIEAWHEAMQGMTLEEGIMAAKQLSYTCVYPVPNMAMFLNVHKDLFSSSIGALEAWDKVREVCRNYIPYRAVEGQQVLQDFDELTYRIARGMGLDRIANAQDNTSNRARFIEQYNQKVEVADKYNMLPMNDKQFLEEIKEHKQKLLK